MTDNPFTRPAFLLERNAPVWLLITGNVRSGREFRRMMEQAIDLRSRGMIDAIRLVTWTGELEQAPGLQQALVSAGISVLVVEPPQPNPKIHPLFHTYVYHQRKALHFGLQSLPSNVFVLKARTDFAEERFDAMTKAIFGNGGADLATDIPSPLLQTRLFTYDARPDFLFYWDDIVFSGMREDLMKLNNFDLSFDLVYQDSSASAEIRLFAPLFLKHYPLLQWIFENMDGKEFARMIQLWLTSANKSPLPSLVNDILASYFHIISRYLLLPNGTRTSKSSLSLESFLRENKELGVIPFTHPWPSHKFVNSTLLEYLRGTNESQDPHLNEILLLMRRMDADPVARGAMGDDFEERLQEFTRFAKTFQSQPLHSQTRLISDKSAPTESPQAGFLNAIPMPEKRYLTRWQQRKLGFRKKLSNWLLRKCL